METPEYLCLSPNRISEDSMASRLLNIRYNVLLVKKGLTMANTSDTFLLIKDYTHQSCSMSICTYMHMYIQYLQ